MLTHPEISEKTKHELSVEYVKNKIEDISK